MEYIEKIEVLKSSGTYYFTGILIDLENDWVEIRTTRNEVLRFRKEQIQDRKVLEEETEGF